MPDRPVPPRRWLTVALLLVCAAAQAQQTGSMPSPPMQTQTQVPGTLPQAGTTDADGIRTEATVVVTGQQPGPGLWRVSKGGHELYILGTLSPLPANMRLQTREIDEVIARSQEVIRAPYITVGSDMSKFKMLFLLPSLIGVKNNPDGKTLKQVLPSDVYVRWQAFKARFLPNKDTERLRPVFAALALYEAGIERSGLSKQDPVQPVLKAAIEKHHPSVTVPKIEIKLNDGKQMREAIRQFKNTEVEDLQCMTRTLDLLGKDLETMRLRANAWATGDIAALQALPITDQAQACLDAMGENAVSRKLGLGDMEVKLQGVWLQKVEEALARNATTFALASTASLLKPGGYLDALRARGYEVEAPY